MATVLAPQDLLTVRLNFATTGESDVAMNVLHYQVVSVSGAAPALVTALGVIGQSVYDHFKQDWSDPSSSAIVFTGVSVTSVFPGPRSRTQTYSPSAPTVGGVSGDALPLQDAPTILKRTNVGARWGMGRLFFVGTAEAMQQEGRLNLLGIGHMNTFANLMDDNISVSGTGWGTVLRPVLKRGPDDNPVSITPITDCALSNDILKTQRRRRPGKGS